MIYLRTSVASSCVGRHADFLAAGNFSGGVFHPLHADPATGSAARRKSGRRSTSSQSNGLSKDNIVLGIPRKDIVLRYLDLPPKCRTISSRCPISVQSFEPTEEDRFYSRLYAAPERRRHEEAVGHAG